MGYGGLDSLNVRLGNSFEDYLSMIAVGSIAVGDPWVEGRSDRDILLVFEQDPSHRLQGIQQVLSGFEFDDIYNFTPLKRGDFGRANSRYAFSNVFRSRTLFGTDFVATAELPDMDTIEKTYSHGLERVRKKIRDHILNSVNWSDQHIRDQFWKRFKHAFMYLAMREYFDTGEYPVRRIDLVERLDVAALRQTFEVLHTIDSQSKERILETGRSLLSFLEGI